MEKDEQSAAYLSSFDPETDENNWEPEDDDFEIRGGNSDNSMEGDSTPAGKIMELPEISDEETKLVDEWWEEYRKMKDTVKEREHLIAFIDRYPRLVDHLELYYEVLFELGGDHFKNGIYEIFVELLLRIRKKYPFTYKKSFQYYDSDLIYWYVAQGRLDEIDPFFDYFREEKKYNGHLEELIQFFHAINRSDILLTSLIGTKYAKHISFITTNNIVQRYIDKPVTDESVQSLMDEFASKVVDYKDYNKENIIKVLLNYTRPFTTWDTQLPQKRSEASEYYSSISMNFARFLYKNTELSFSDAIVISDCIEGYYNRIVNRGNKRPANIFCLDRKTIFNITLKYYDLMFWGYNMVCFIELNALYYFTSYLKTCGNISEKQMNELQKMITNLYQEAYAASENVGPEMLSFKQFPLWRIKG